MRLNSSSNSKVLIKEPSSNQRALDNQLKNYLDRMHSGIQISLEQILQQQADSIQELPNMVQQLYASIQTQNHRRKIQHQKLQKQHQNIEVKLQQVLILLQKITLTMDSKFNQILQYHLKQQQEYPPSKKNLFSIADQLPPVHQNSQPLYKIKNFSSYQDLAQENNPHSIINGKAQVNELVKEGISKVAFKNPEPKEKEEEQEFSQMLRDENEDNDWLAHEEVQNSTYSKLSQQSEMSDFPQMNLSGFEKQQYPPQKVLEMISPALEEMSIKLTSGALLYSFPEMKEINFHEKIDSKQNLMILIQLQNNQLIGGFTKLCFDPKPNYIPKENAQSFLCNLTQKRFAFAHRINKTHSYDKNYFLMGNWEIKIKAGQNKMECNWGNRGDSFGKQHFKGKELINQNRSWLLGDEFEGKEVSFAWYKIYHFF